MFNIPRDADQIKENHSILSKKLSRNTSSETYCNIISWNVWSILNDEKLSNFLQILEDQNFQIACITETWFNTRNGKFTAAIKEAGFKLIHSYREDKPGCGTLIMYKSLTRV